MGKKDFLDLRGYFFRNTPRTPAMSLLGFIRRRQKAMGSPLARYRENKEIGRLFFRCQL